MSFNKKFFQTGGIVASSPASAPLPNDEISLWEFEGNFNDTNNVNNGTNNGVLITNGGNTPFGSNHGYWDNSNDYVDVGLSNLPADFTFTAWFKVPDKSDFRPVIGKWYDGANRDFQLALFSTSVSYPNGAVSFLYSDTGSDQITYTHTDTYSTNDWQFVAISFDDQNQFILNINGVNETVPISITQNRNTQNVFIGQEDYRRGDSIRGYIDQVRYFDRALSAEELNALYNE